MKVPLSWLKDYVDITMSPEELAYTLTMAGLEVEAVEYTGADWGDKIITAQIVHLEKVPGSDHLSYARVITGKEELGVICGAPVSPFQVEVDHVGNSGSVCGARTGFWPELKYAMCALSA